MNKTVAITGANGFIGTELVRQLHATGHQVIALVHRMPEHQITGVAYHRYDLKDKPDSHVFANVDTLIHLAFSFTRPQKWEPDINLMAAKALLNLNLKNYIFVSSFSAAANATAYYGKCKHELETLFADHTIIRPGLVAGNGGLFSRLRIQIKNNPLVPLLAGGRQPMQLIAVSDLIIGLEKLIGNPIRGIFNLAHPKAITYKQMMVLASSSGNKKPKFIPVPIVLMRMAIRLARLLGKRDISEDNLDGLLNAHVVNTVPDLAKLELNLTATDELMNRVDGSFVN